MHVYCLSVPAGQILMWFGYVLSKSAVGVWARAGVSPETLLGKGQTPNLRCGWWDSCLADCGPGVLSAHGRDAAFGSLPGGPPSARPQPGVLLLERQQEDILSARQTLQSYATSSWKWQLPSSSSSVLWKQVPTLKGDGWATPAREEQDSGRWHARGCLTVNHC